MADLPQTKYNVWLNEPEFPGDDDSPECMTETPLPLHAALNRAIDLVLEVMDDGFYYNGIQPITTATRRQRWELKHNRSDRTMVIEVKAVQS